LLLEVINKVVAIDQAGGFFGEEAWSEGKKYRENQ